MLFCGVLWCGMCVVFSWWQCESFVVAVGGKISALWWLVEMPILFCGLVCLPKHGGGSNVCVCCFLWPVWPWLSSYMCRYSVDSKSW